MTVASMIGGVAQAASITAAGAARAAAASGIGAHRRAVQSVAAAGPSWSGARHRCYG